MSVKLLNLIGCARLRYTVIRSKSGRIRQFPGLGTPRFSEVFGDRIFLATEKVRFGKNPVPDTRRTRHVSWNTILPDLPVFSKNTGPYRGISGPRHVLFHAVLDFIYVHPIVLWAHAKPSEWACQVFKRTRAGETRQGRLRRFDEVIARFVEGNS